jgi:regulator of protease activity HflC (stomatin/prohibitin superfamily)
MNIGLIIAAVFVIAFAGAVFFSFTQYKKKKSKKVALGAVLAAVCGLGFVFLPSSVHTVQAGEVAVVKYLGKAEKVRTAGTYFDFWVTNTYDIYDAKVQNMVITTQAYSKDAQTMDVAMTVQYQIDTSKVIDIANKYGSLLVLGDRIESIATEKTKSMLSSYSAMSIIETRATISPKVEEIIKETVTEEYCVNIVAVVLTNIDFSPAFEKTVEDKMIAEQEKLKAEYEKETAIVNAEKELEVAKLAAEAKIESAKADAQAQVEAAKAEARAIQLKSIEVARALGFVINEEVVTDEDGVQNIEYTIDFTGKSAEEIQVITDYMKYIEYLAKWDGKLPTVVAGESATIMIPTPSA